MGGPNRVIKESKDVFSCALSYGQAACSGELGHLRSYCCCQEGTWWGQHGGKSGCLPDWWFDVCDKFAYIHTTSSMSTVSGVVTAFLEQEHAAKIEVYSEIIPHPTVWGWIEERFNNYCGVGKQFSQYTVVDSAGGNQARNCMLAFALTSDWEAEEDSDVAMLDQDNLNRTAEFVA